MAVTVRFRPTGWEPPVVQALSGTAAGSSADSATIAAPGAPTNLRLTTDPVEGTSVELAWDAPATGGMVTSYELLRDGVAIETGITGTSATDDTVSAGQSYSYTVRAVGPGGTGEESSALEVEVPAAPATTVEVSPSTFEIEVEETVQLTATVDNPVGSTTWESSDEDVATVSSSGLVTGVSEGSVTITATNNGVSDSASGTVAEAAEPGAYIFGPGTNEPSGLHPFFAWDPGTHGIDMREAHGDGASGALFGPNSDWFDGRMTIVPDAGTPGGFALRQEWPAGTGTRSGNAGWNWSAHTPDPDLYPGWNGQIGELKTLYVRFLHFKETSWVHNPNNAKLIGFEMAVDHVNGLDAYLQDMSRDEVWWRWQFSVNRGADFGEHESSDEDFPGFVQTGKWYDIEFLIIAQSAPGVADGQLHVWVNGAKVPGWNNVTLGGSSDGTGLEVVSEGGAGTGYEGINVWPYYNGGSQVLKTKDEYMRWGGLYMSGSRSPISL